MSSSGPLSQPVNTRFSQFAPAQYFSHLPTVQSQTLPNRIKLKRSRQRVDAGEPRNSYQASRQSMLQQRFSNGLQPMSNGDSAASPLLNANFSWLTPTDTSDAVTHATQNEEIKDYDVAEDLSQHNMENDSIMQEAIQSNPIQNFSTCEDDEEVVNTVAHAPDEEVRNKEDKDSSSSSPMPVTAGSSSSRRKNTFPQRNHIPKPAESCDMDSDVLIADQCEEAKRIDETQQNVLNANLGACSQPNKLNEMLEVQRRIYSQWIEQQRKMMGINDEENKRALILQVQQQLQRDFTKLAQSLKQELICSMNNSIDKVVNEFVNAEAITSAQRILALAMSNSFEKETASLGRNPFLFQPFYHQLNGQFSNPFMHSTMHPSGIFPSVGQPTGFTPFITHLKVASPTPNVRKATEDNSLHMPRKKRSKVTDSTRLNKVTASGNKETSFTDSARSSPILSSYFPPTMVGHPMYGHGSFRIDEHESPTNSDGASDCGPFEGNFGSSSTLTPMHLRKAKLMFFYTRYPNSALLKSYFPDIRFNKNNTAQLVKWFSNFREFFYNQMDKYARNYLAEGVRNKEDIVVTIDSEIFKNLNQHYNRNNHIQPPEKLSLVIQETLREFFSAVQSGRDVEPSWKKTIYKVINRMDDVIPEYFKEPNFLERLEG